MNKFCAPSDLFEGFAGICEGDVSGIVSPALPSDLHSPSLSPSVYCCSQSGRSSSRSSGAVGGRSPDTGTASLRGRVSTQSPSTTIGTNLSRLHLMMFPSLVDVDDCFSFDPIRRNDPCSSNSFLARAQLVSVPLLAM